MGAWLGTVLRLVVGGVWLVAGGLKLEDPAESVRAVRAYDLLPESIVPTVGHLLPLVEVAVGLCLILGLLTRASAVISGLLFVAFVIGIASAWARGLQIDCGCFGGGGFDPDAAAAYPWEIARDVALLVASAWLVWGPGSRFALDTIIFGSTPPIGGAEPGPGTTSPGAQHHSATEHLLAGQHLEEKQ